MSSRIDAEAYVLGLLTDAERARAEDLERTDPVFARDVRALRALSLRLDALGTDEWRPQEPPPLAPPARRHHGEPAPLPWWRRATAPTLRLSPVVGAAAAAVLIVAGAGASALLGADGGSGSAGSPAATLALARFGEGPAGAGGRAFVTAHRGQRQVQVVGHGLAPNRGRTFYEVWMLRDATHLISVGTFRVGADGRVRVTLPVSVDPGEYPIMDVSLEPDDGNPAHSHRSVLRSSGSQV